jgi:hypothetical protein
VIGRAADTLTAATGHTLGAVFRTVGAIPHRDKPLHPRGQVRRATLRRRGFQPPTGVDFLDTTRTDEVIVRESRSVGLPDGLPDVSGLAIRVTEDDGTPGDLLFSTTGWGPLTRYVLTLSRSTYGRPMTTLIPYRSAAGPVLLGVRASVADRLELAGSVDRGPWVAFGEVELGPAVGDLEVSFDPVLNLVPGLEQYDVVRRIREPAYRGARASRHDPRTEVGRPR